MAKRTNQTDRTRRAIIDTATEMFFTDTSPESLTMQEVADRAGVSHRTLYRYYPSRGDLVNAVGAAFDESASDRLVSGVLESFDTWISSATELAQHGTVQADTMKRGMAFAITTGEWRTDRDDAYWKLFRSEFPHLDKDVARQDFAVLRSVLWGAGTVLLRSRFGLTASEVGAGIDRGVRVLIAGIRERDELAARENGSSR